MSHLTDLPPWAAALVCGLLLIGAATTFIGSLGLLRLPDFYARLHAPTIATSGGTILICLASILCFAVLQSRWVFHEVLIIFFMTVTTPVTLMLLGQATLYRDRFENRPGVPRKSRPSGSKIEE
ncbi:cation:proton antiporter [Sinorhizobium medicae]|uniref:Cation:proton antiporter n=2 Tax=Sinorhizobium medicae TaxID=110321 RepID=A0A508WY02_9HYPH|nr:monovalent cation/H(+) antiporter subunit G [Sinorhizobium medicae]ABR61641.1 monovalent cation/proton antiporter, MnhG/PhaG subunit [Sinorhizobium medicae WSM419]MBO1941476.1 cation:proton antiporter [Sinorhizobium medicae]MBO1959373.1 cation:proton antiporter [Sinorhizobium medicae]MDX0405367.1 cation:proton antiporter [Sinorhizobium medicae]MDX0410649.1 cation:proton antiporter [Sinorhizobium medicae]